MALMVGWQIGLQKELENTTFSQLLILAMDQKFEEVKKDLSAQLMKFLEKTQDPALKGIVAEPEVPEKGPKRYIYDFEVGK